MKTGKIPASAETGQRGAHDGALVKKEARQGWVARQANLGNMYTPSDLLYFFFLHIHRTFHSTKYVKTHSAAGRKHYGRSGTTSIKERKRKRKHQRQNK